MVGKVYFSFYFLRADWSTCASFLASHTYAVEKLWAM